VTTPEFHLFLPQMRMALDTIVARAQAAEAAGFEGVWGIDHFSPPGAPEGGMYEAMTTSMWLAARSSRLSVGSLVLCDSVRHPALLAQQAVTIDHASGGRFELGIGSGSVPEELATFGIGAMSTGERIDRLDETLEVLRALWTGERFDHEGTYFALHGAMQRPVPTRPIPVVIGGTGPRMMALVARHADWWNVPTHQLDRLDEMRPRAGGARVSLQQMVAFVPSESAREEVAALAARRFPPSNNVVVGDPAELVDHYGSLRERGVERFYVWFTDFADPATLAAFGERVIDAVRA
jgi:alkanesulfonate monooxygenase SsuD/methylene tetrahydromethanopterin reductase-like flavin-dependent oxidoreductase (luciferase family)